MPTLIALSRESPTEYFRHHDRWWKPLKEFILANCHDLLHGEANWWHKADYQVSAQLAVQVGNRLERLVEQGVALQYQV